ncbi:hypothetical protein QBC34DRAFT_288253 [Podospora aff. communis PSN243]|uniref:C2H2-type domain-containing protein n=1 Tax=Podospora aff. communis PSN243 TaxID=3040156 RepID=A0AAV9H842_9PEZI|nr:hypothetical protein QBC34DRAFT_288253 [Podospora aff. communis PSN243]
MFSNTRLNTGGNDDWTDVQSVQALDEPKDNPRLLACPFHKHDPVYYASREHPDFGGKRHLYRACMGGFRSIQRLKEHLKRIHSPVQCERCYEVFPGTDRASCLARLAEHRKMDPCELGDPSFKRGIDESQWAALDKQNRKKNQELHRVEKWYEIWDVLFPGKERPATPWYSIPDPIISVPTGAEDDFSNLFVNIMDHKLLQGDVDLSTPQSVRDGVKRIAKVAIKTYINIRRPFPGSELESESHQTRPRASYAASSAAWTGSISGFSRPYATTAATSVFSGYEFQRPQFPAKPRPPTFDEDPE